MIRPSVLDEPGKRSGRESQSGHSKDQLGSDLAIELPHQTFYKSRSKKSEITGSGALTLEMRYE